MGEEQISKPKRAIKTKKPALEKLVTFRISAEDKLAYEKKVLLSGLNSSKFFRECVLTNKTQIVVRASASLEKKRVMFIYNKVSNNVNQIAHNLNSANLTKKIDDKSYQDALSNLIAITNYLKAALNNVD